MNLLFDEHERGLIQCEEFLSDCCGAPKYHDDVDICSDCQEHSGFYCEDCGAPEYSNSHKSPL